MSSQNTVPHPNNLFRFFLIFFFCLFLIYPAAFGQKKILILNRGDHSFLSKSLDLPGGALSSLTDEGLLNPYDFVLDQTTQQLIWSDGFNNRIIQAGLFQAANQSFSEATVISPVDLEIDPISKKLYWVDNGEGRIYRSEMDGSGQELIPTDSLANPSALAVFPGLNLLFYADIDQKRIWSSELNGANAKIFVEKDLNYPVRLLIDRARGKLYWADDGSQLIERINFDGSNREVFYQGTETEFPFGLYLEESSGYLYWTDYGEDKIMRAHVQNGKPAETVETGLSDPIALVIYNDTGFGPGGKDRQAVSEIAPRVSLYPNPADRLVTFVSLQSGQQIDQIRIFDPLGKEIYFHQVRDQTFQLDIRHYPEGYYRYAALVSGTYLFGHFSIIH